MQPREHGPGADEAARRRPRSPRAAFPTRINFIRTAPSDDIQGPALASFVFHDLGAKSTLVIDDADQGREIADEFSRRVHEAGWRPWSVGR